MHSNTILYRQYREGCSSQPQGEHLDFPPDISRSGWLAFEIHCYCILKALQILITDGFNDLACLLVAAEGIE
jgi:hypothetical protein